jgi:hypothetical protein
MATVRRVVVSGTLIAALLTSCSEPQAAPDEIGPADAYVHLVLDMSREAAEQEEMRYQELLAACMAEAGFEYVPSLTNMSFVDEAAIDPPRGSREFAQAYGYGLAALPAGARSPYRADPNDDILAAMSQAQAAEYFSARDGTWSEGDAGWKPGGCDVWARGEMQAVAADHDPVYVALKAEVDRIEAEVVPAHPVVMAVDRAWSACMSDAGFPGYARQPEAEERERERFETPEVADGAIGPDGLTDGQRAELPLERALATADWDCTDEVGYAPVVARVRNEAQQVYVDARRDELDAWVEDYASKTDTPTQGIP